MKRATIRGVRGDRVHLILDVDPLDQPLGYLPKQFVFVTASELDGACFGDRNAVCAMLTLDQAAKLGEALRVMVRDAGKHRSRR